MNRENYLMNKLISLYQKAKTVAKFCWRHFFTLSVTGMVVSVFVQAPVNWEGALLYLCIAVLMDWGKMRLKFSGTNAGHQTFNEMYQAHTKLDNYYASTNPCVPGTGAYHLTNLGRNY